MRVGIYTDLRNPPGWRRPWAAHYAATMDRIAEAERLGVDSVWVTEHHFFEDGYLPQPLTMAAAIAGRTSRVRIGTAVLLAPLRLPLQIAEEAASSISSAAGGWSSGWAPATALPEFAAFGADPSRRLALLRRGVREIRRLWEDGRLHPAAGSGPRADLARRHDRARRARRRAPGDRPAVARRGAARAVPARAWPRAGTTRRRLA